MLVYCTYCSSKKNRSSHILPAIKRYKSNRISAIYKTAFSQNIPMLILSGKHGLLNTQTPIHFYNYLLKADDVDEHAEKVAEQLRGFGVKELVFFSRSIDSDPNLSPYIECMKKAAEVLSLKINFIEIPNSN